MSHGSESIFKDLKKKKNSYELVINQTSYKVNCIITNFVVKQKMDYKIRQKHKSTRLCTEHLKWGNNYIALIANYDQINEG